MNKLLFSFILIATSFTLSAQENVKEQKDSAAIIIIEENPEFPGGMVEMYKYISKNLKYPEKAKKDKIEGKVIVTFVIETDGSISNVEVFEGIGGGCDEEAVRIVKKMPKWKPGKQKGKAVRVQFRLPIMFIL